VSKASLEFHDSRLTYVAVGGHKAVLELAPASVHHWAQRAGQWIGAGWLRQRAKAGVVEGRGDLWL